MADTTSDIEVTDVCDSGTEISSSQSVKVDKNDNFRVPLDTLALGNQVQREETANPPPAVVPSRRNIKLYGSILHHFGSP